MHLMKPPPGENFVWLRTDRHASPKIWPSTLHSVSYLAVLKAISRYFGFTQAGTTLARETQYR